MTVPPDWSAKYTRGGNQAFISGVSEVRAICPHCEIASTFAIRSQDFFVINNTTEVRLVLNCNYARCKRVSYVETVIPHNRLFNQPTDYFFMNPSRLVAPAHPSIPPAIADDWREARVAMYADAPKAAAVMFRRVLYSVLMDKRINKLRPINDALKQLIQNERLPAMFDEWLPAIGDDGHDGAHPDRALQVSPENIEETMEYTAELLRYLYIEPYEFERRKRRNSENNQPNAKPSDGDVPSTNVSANPSLL
jgi:Domain of unknown function (DUF4145)